MDRHDIISHNPGTVFIKHTDSWHGTSYLKDDLSFTPHRDHASKFYLLKSNDPSIINSDIETNNNNTAITNGDRISINIDNRSLTINGSQLLFEHQERLRYTTGVQTTGVQTTPGNTFLIVNGTNDNEPIVFNTPLFLIIDKITKQALKYNWDLNLNNILDRASFKQNNRPTLVVASYDNLPEQQINSFKFSLEHSDSPNMINNSTNKLHPQVQLLPNKESTVLFSDNYKGSIILVLLLIILVVCALIGKH